MSFPYDLDLMFGSEKSTVDSSGRVSFGKNGGGRGSGWKGSSFPLALADYDGTQRHWENEIDGNVTWGHLEDFEANPDLSDPLPEGFFDSLSSVYYVMPRTYGETMTLNIYSSMEYGNGSWYFVNTNLALVHGRLLFKQYQDETYTTIFTAKVVFNDPSQETNFYALPWRDDK